MSNSIKHSGIIETIGEECVKVRILQTSACAGCKIAGHCNSSESKEKVVDVYGVVDISRMKVGDKVVVTASVSTAASALLVGFGLPFIVLVAVTFAVYAVTADEAMAALSGLGALIPYYIVVWLMREKLRAVMTFGIDTGTVGGDATVLDE